MTCLKYYLLCLLTETVFYLHFIIHDTTAKKKSLVIFFFSAILRIQFTGRVTKSPSVMVSSAPLVPAAPSTHLIVLVTA